MDIINETVNALLENEDIGRTIEIIENEEECPYFLGSSDEELDIEDRYDLDEDELFATGWVGAVQNEDEGPFNTYEDIDIYCYDLEKSEGYDLPEISEDLKKEFLEKVNNWIKQNSQEE